MTTDILAGLNERQREAVTTGAGPVLVLAGPGSGKTRVLTHRIAYLIRDVGVPPDAIMAVTFTNKAAGEMRRRIDNLLDGRVRGLRIGTFHAICARILRIEGERTAFGQDYVIYDTDDQEAVMKQTLGELNIDPKKFTPRRMLHMISSLKNELIEPKDFRPLEYIHEIVARVYPRYQAILLDNNAMDFDDLLMQTVMLFRDNDDILERYHRYLDFVLVDEFQDTNAAQYRLVQLLGRPRDNVFVVGDEDQGIYAFRGADYRNVLEFRKDFPECKVILLEQNYRSTQVVLDAARAVIDKNPNRTPKALFTEREGGDPIILHEAYSEDFEARFVIEQIESLRRDQGYEWDDFAIMYRTNAQSRALEDVCIREGIPYKLIGGVGFYKRREIRDLLAYLRVVNNANDKISFNRIINVPRRGIGNKSLTQFQYWAANECVDYDDALTRLMTGEKNPLGGRPARLFADFGETLFRWRELAQSGQLLNLFDTIVAEIGYNLYLQDISDSPEQAVDRSENVQELRGLIAHAEQEEFTLTEFLAEQSLVADVDALEAGADSITLLTLHSAKGLEFPVVFITGLEDGLLPHMRSFDEPDGMAEERRLLYVGMTRAMNHLFLTYAFRRSMWGRSEANATSRFLADLPTELVEGLSPAQKVQQDITRFKDQIRWDSPVFGAGSPFKTGNRSDSAWPEDKPPRKSNSKIKAKIVPFPGGEAKFNPKQRVNHVKFGAGTVIASRGRGADETVMVAFDNASAGTKEISAEYLTKLE